MFENSLEPFTDGNSVHVIVQNQTLLHKAAEGYLNRYQWACMPLTLDTNGLPKRPMVNDWPNLKAYMPDIDALPWTEAAGLGIVLGPTSNNLGVLDIDSQPLARAIYAILQSHRQPAYVVRTVRKRIHLYIRESVPSASSWFPVTWEGEEVLIEFKAQGTQVAASPTPGYAIIEDHLEEWKNLETFWRLLDARLRHLHPDDYRPVVARPGGSPGSAPAWTESVRLGQRNNTLYVEAHKLREAGMPHTEALSILLTRARLSYEGGQAIPEHEIRQTIASAYRKGVVTKNGDTSGPREFNPL